MPGDATNLVSLTRKTYAGPLEVGEDLMSFEIGQSVTVHRRDLQSRVGIKFICNTLNSTPRRPLANFPDKLDCRF